MKYSSPFRFIISPADGEQYINTKQIGDNELIINTSIEEAIDVQRLGVVRGLPIGYKGNICVGDLVVVHHNTFRITFDHNGVAVQSNNYIKDDLFYISPDLIYMVIKNGEKYATDDNVFVEPIIEEDFWTGKKELQHIGIVRYSNKELEEKGVVPGTKIAFRKNCEYEFTIKNERLYNMKNKRILAILN